MPLFDLFCGPHSGGDSTTSTSSVTAVVDANGARGGETGEGAGEGEGERCTAAGGLHLTTMGGHGREACVVDRATWGARAAQVLPCGDSEREGECVLPGGPTRLGDIPFCFSFSFCFLSI